MLGCSHPTKPYPHFRAYDSIPTWSPDGRLIAYLHSSRDATDPERIAIVDTSGSQQSPAIAISPAVSPQLTWSPDGSQIAYYSGGICTVTLDDRAIRRWSGPFAAYPAWSPDGRYLIYLITARAYSEPDSTAGLRIIDTHVGDQRTLFHHDSLTTFGSYPVWSPGGRQIAFMSNEAAHHGNICIVNDDGTEFRQVTDVNGWCADLQWSSDGQRLYFHFTPSSSTFGDASVTKSYVVNVDGSGLRKLPLNLGDPRVHFWFQFQLSHPGDKVAFSRLDATGKGGVIWMMNLDGSGRRQLTTP